MQFRLKLLAVILAVAPLATSCSPDKEKESNPEQETGITDANRADTSVGEETQGSDISPDMISSDAEADTADTSAPFDTEWLINDDDTSSGHLAYNETPDEFYEYAHFRYEAPFRVHTLKAMLEVPKETEVTLHVWDDYGGNGAALDDGDNLGENGPLATVTRKLEPSDSGDWVEFQLSPPVEIDPGGMIFAGLVVDGEDSPQLHQDGAQPKFEQLFPRSAIWKTNESRRQGGGFPVFVAPGDFMIRLEIEKLLDVPAGNRTFEAKPTKDVGLPSVSRAALADVDNDGDLDVMTNGPKLYLNDGDGNFSDATNSWLSGISGSNGGVFGDYDNDGDPDYFATGKADKLLRNEGDKFVDVTSSSKIDDTQQFTCGMKSGKIHLPTEAATWLDIDNDGYLDLYQANFLCWDTAQTVAPDTIWHNEGDGTFTKMNLPVGSGTSSDPAQAGRGLAPADANGDGWVDLLVTNYRLDENFFLKNKQGNLIPLGTPTNLAGVGTNRGSTTYFGHSIGAAWGDIDHDGHLDVYVANLAHPRFIHFSQKATLYRNEFGSQNRLSFRDETERAGFLYQETASNPNFWDYDNDADLDLFYTCVYKNRPSLFYQNNGHPDWEEVSYRTGVRVENGWGSVVGDLDGDADLDLIARDKIFFNRNPSGAGAVFVKPVGSGAGKTNRDAVGARVEATIDGKKVVREEFGGHGTGVQDSPWLHVGLGQNNSTDLTVKFPATGKNVMVQDAKAGERITVREDGRVSRK